MRRARRPGTNRTPRGRTTCPPQRRLPPGLPERQWDLKAGVAREQGTLVSLREIVNDQVPILHPSRLSGRQMVALTVSRLAQFPDYRLRDLLTGKLIDQKQAIRHVRRRTRLGRFMVEVELEIVRSALERARRSPARPRAGRRRSGMTRGA